MDHPDVAITVYLTASEGIGKRLGAMMPTRSNDRTELKRILFRGSQHVR